jgi:ABC-type branched-subunit amino acid transport system ATPase component
VTPLLSVERLTAGYGEVEIVHEVSLDIDGGEIVTIIGPNGAGKSTMLKAIFGLLTPFSGSVTFDGVDVTSYDSPKMVAAGASFVPQTENVFPSLSIHENLEMGGYQRKSGVNERIDEILAMFPDLASRPKERASRLSGGQRQALAIGRALMLDPSLLLIDEVSAALSPIMREEIFERVTSIASEGVAVLMIEQNAAEALAISDRGYVLVAGQNALEQDASEMLANPEVGRLFLGRDESDDSDGAALAPAMPTATPPAQSE